MLIFHLFRMIGQNFIQSAHVFISLKIYKFWLFNHNDWFFLMIVRKFFYWLLFLDIIIQVISFYKFMLCIFFPSYQFMPLLTPSLKGWNLQNDCGYTSKFILFYFILLLLICKVSLQNTKKTVRCNSFMKIKSIPRM